MVRKGQFYIIEATLAGVALILLLGSLFYLGIPEYKSSSTMPLENYCEDSLQVLIKKNLLKNESLALKELESTLPSNVRGCLILDKERVNPEICSKLSGERIGCSSIYTYLDNGKYKAEEVRLILS